MPRKKENNKTVIACTCRVENYGWIRDCRLYNLPLPVGSCVPRDRAAAYAAVTHIAVYALDLPVLAYTAKYVREVDGAWLAANGYGRAVAPRPPHADRYALFELGKPVAEASLYGKADTDVFVCSTRWTGKIDADFFSRPLPQCGGKSVPNIFERIRPFFPKLHSVRAFNPVQTDFFNIIMPEKTMQYATLRKNSYRIVSLFAGCGGLDLGFIGGFEFLGATFKRNKFDVVWANELNPSACKTYERNLGAHIVCGDIKDHIKSIPSDVDIVMGGFPCQDISINGKMQGIKGKRSSLYSYIVEAVKRCRPKVFLAENVGSLMLKQHEHSFKTILADFEALDYNVTYKVYHAEQYGVPQTRERIIFVGTRKDLPVFKPPEPVSGGPITCGEALRDLEDMPADKGFSHIWSAAAPSGEQGCRKMIEDRPGYTIRAECHGNIQFHYKLPRRLSMREAARIQSFPDSYVFPCGIRETERQIGNAVPPVLAWHIARKVQKILEAAR